MKSPFRSLPTRISSFVFAAVLITSLTVTAISVNSIDTFLRGKIDQKFPQILLNTSERLDFWYDQRAREIAVFAGSEILLENVPLIQRKDTRDRARSEIEQYLRYVLESFPQYQALFVLGTERHVVLSVGEEGSLAAVRKVAHSVGSLSLTGIEMIDSRPVQVVSAGIERGVDPTHTLHAVLRVELLADILHSIDLGASGEIFMVGRDGRRVQLAPDEQERMFGRPLPEDEGPSTVSDYLSPMGERVVGCSLHFPRFGWTLVVQEAYADAFTPVVSAIRRILGINLAIVLLLGLGAFRIAVSIVRPIEALSDAAQRISEGDLDVDLPESETHDEVGLLTRTFAGMTRRLAENQSKLEESQAEVEEANRRLRTQNRELQRVNEVLEQLSITDGLTKLHNHRFFQDYLIREAKRADRTAEPLALILVDIDHFKRWNDRLGHAGGDEILRRIADVMNDIIRETDLLARYGGEEFALLTPNTDLDGSIQLAEKIRTSVSQAPFMIDVPSEQEALTVSIGVALFQGDRQDLFNEADRQLYRAKAAGRDCVMAEGYRSPDSSGPV